MIRDRSISDMDSLQPFSILIVDDQAMDIAQLRFLAWQLGIEAELAFSGNEAWKAMGQKKYDLVILDWHMPDGSGQEFLMRLERFIRDHGKRYMCNRVVVHTGSPERIREFSESNVRILDVWEKPTSPVELLKKLSKLQYKKGA